MEAGAGAAPRTRKPGQSAHTESTQGSLPDFPRKQSILEMQIFAENHRFSKETTESRRLAFVPLGLSSWTSVSAISRWPLSSGIMARNTSRTNIATLRLCSSLMVRRRSHMTRNAMTHCFLGRHAVQKHRGRKHPQPVTYA